MIDSQALSFEEAEERAHDYLVGVLGYDRAAASRLVRRATRQEAVREGGRADKMGKRYQS